MKSFTNESKRSEATKLSPEEYAAGVEQLKNFFDLDDAEFAVLEHYIYHDGVERAIKDPQDAVDKPGSYNICERLIGYMRGLSKDKQGMMEALPGLYEKIMAKSIIPAEAPKSPREVKRERVLKLSQEIEEKQKALRALIDTRDRLEESLEK